MQVSYKWLKEYVDVPFSPNDLARELTFRGVAVETVTDLDPGIENVCVGEIRSIETHPAADRLLVCRIDVGGEVLTIVTGAPNLHVGDKVPAAKPGSRLPRGWAIGATDFRGVVSQGMLCSETELLEGNPHKENEGIWILPSDARPGTSMAELLDLDDAILELDLTPNYASHCLSMVGVAREVAAITGGRVRLPETEAPASPRALEESPVEDMISIDIEARDLCDRYTARVIKNVRIGPSPLWMQNRLRAAGMRPINNIVDVTNYVMLEMGQPLHAFDYEAIRGRRIIVRRAREGEILVTLDGQERKLDPDMLVIADAEGPTGLAGVMGGLISEITDGTRTILLESAHFDNRNNRRTSRRLGLLSEASARFTKGVDPNGTAAAADRACHLIRELGGGDPLPGAVDCYPTVVPPRAIALRPARANAILGLNLSRREMVNCLKRLDLQVLPGADVEDDSLREALQAACPASPSPGGREARARAIEGEVRRVREELVRYRSGGHDPLLVIAPTRRPDLAAEIDLIEEIARIDGYHHIPATLPQGPLTRGSRTPRQKLALRTREALLGAGLTEILPYAFENPRGMELIRAPEDSPLRAQIRLQNPISEEWSAMRTSLIPSMMETLSHNASWRQEDVAFFELGTVYRAKALPLTELPEEKVLLCAAAAGAVRAKGWNQPREEADFYFLKGVLETLLEQLDVPGYRFEPSNYPSFHPGRQAVVLVADRSDSSGEVANHGRASSEWVEVGVIGEINPDVEAAYNLPRRVYLTELDWDALEHLAGAGRRYQPLPRYPSISRDLALVIGDEVPADRVAGVIRERGGDLLKEVNLFDLYRGAPVAEGRRSLAYNLIYRAGDRTLTDQEVDAVHDGIRQALVGELGAELRS